MLFRSGFAAVVRDGCWLCVEAQSCTPLAEAACAADATLTYTCPQAGWEAPFCACEGGRWACAEAPRRAGCCGDGAPVTCDAEPPACAEGSVPAPHLGCWACVDAELCSDP